MSETRRTTDMKCRLCGQRHGLRQCRAFLAMKPEERYECARNHRYCINCLAVSHATGACDSPSSCRKCSLGHHTLLHRVRSATNTARRADPTPRRSGHANQRSRAQTRQRALQSRSARQREENLRNLVAEARAALDRIDAALNPTTRRAGGEHVEDMILFSD